MQALLSHPFLSGGGALLVLIGLLCMRWASRHDLKGLAVDAAWQVAWNRKLGAATDTEIAQRLKDVSGEATNAGKARKAAGLAVRHALAQAVSLAGLIGIGLGIILIGLAFYLG
ncbi:MAG TPA: hypothetical protein VFV47_11580 [Hyphomicrobiaceae bacterium]|nr:hypothetical protein [Hyphomicrobiaceae bacterium]